MDTDDTKTERSDRPTEPVPAPTYAPPAMAMAIMLLFWGLVTHWFASLTGLALMTFALAKWINDVRSGWRARS